MKILIQLSLILFRSCLLSLNILFDFFSEISYTFFFMFCKASFIKHYTIPLYYVLLDVKYFQDSVEIKAIKAYILSKDHHLLINIIHEVVAYL